MLGVDDRQRIGELGLELPDRVVDCGELAFLVGRWRLDQWIGVSLTAVETFFGHVVEEGVEPVIVLLRDRVELVVVALGAGDGEPQEDGAGRVHAIDDVGGVILFGDRASLEIEHVVAVESAGDLLRDGGVRQKVARELFDDEAVVG